MQKNIMNEIYWISLIVIYWHSYQICLTPLVRENVGIRQVKIKAYSCLDDRSILTPGDLVVSQ